jgi:predicted nucleic acid-binding protein
MNGSVKVLLDTNVIIGLLKANPAAVALLRDHGLSLTQCAYSSITRMELLGFPGIIEAEQQTISDLLTRLMRCPVTLDVENAVITLRRNRRIKLPDAIIAATANVFNLNLLTLDKELAKMYASLPPTS